MMRVSGIEHREVTVEVDPLQFVVSMERAFYGLLGIPKDGTDVCWTKGHWSYRTPKYRGGFISHIGPEGEEEDREALEALLTFKKWLKKRLLNDANCL